VLCAGRDPHNAVCSETAGQRDVSPTAIAIGAQVRAIKRHWDRHADADVL